MASVWRVFYFSKRFSQKLKLYSVTQGCCSFECGWKFDNSSTYTKNSLIIQYCCPKWLTEIIYIKMNVHFDLYQNWDTWHEIDIVHHWRTAERFMGHCDTIVYYCLGYN